MSYYRHLIAKTIGYPVQDLFKNTSILRTLVFLRESQYWSLDQIFDYQSIKLNALIEHAYRNVPYYEKLFDKIKLKPSDIRTVFDITKIPVLTKEVARKENMNLIARNFNMRHVKRGTTGGTTGTPIVTLKDSLNRTYTWASYYRWYEWMGINYFDAVATFWGSRSVTTKSTKQRLLDNIVSYVQNNYRVNAFELSEERMFKTYTQLKKNKPLLIKGYVSALIDFATFLDQNNYNALRPIAISSTSETLLPEHRNYLENVFSAPIYDQYGCGEVSAISYECSKHKGLHVNTEHVYCEIIDDNGTPIFDKTGGIVCTDLNNYVMPFIRYENGDVSLIETQRCDCGVHQPLMRAIEGRSIDRVQLKNGSKVHGVFFSKIFTELGISTNMVQKFQILQKKPDAIELRVQCQKPLPESLRASLIIALKKHIDKVIYSEHVFLAAEPTGKFKYIKNMMTDITGDIGQQKVTF